MQGFIYLHRKITEWQWYQNHTTRCLFIHLLLKANHKQNYYQGELVKEGELITSLNNLAEQLNLSIKQIRNGLKKLEKTKEIEIKKDKRWTHLIICNYKNYQNYEKEKGKERANEGQGEGKRGATNNTDNTDNTENTDIVTQKKSKNKYKDAYKEFEDVNYFLSSFEDWEIAVVGEDLLKSFHLHKLQMGCTFNAIKMAKDKIKKDIQNYKRKDLINAITKAVASGKWLDYYMEDYTQLDFHDKEFYIENYKQGNYELF